MKKILLIDDDVFFVRTLGDALLSKGYTVARAENGEEGLKKVEEDCPDLILLDLRMPKMDGFEFLKNLQEKNKEHSSFPVPIFIVSNMADTENISSGLEYGVKGYIVKANETVDTIIEDVEKVLGE